MAEHQITFAELVTLLRARNPRSFARNLVLVALPLATAHRESRRLAEVLGAKYIDFDCGFLAQLAIDDWAEHVMFERRKMFSFGQRLGTAWLRELAQQLTPDLPLVIGNINLAVRYDIDLAAGLYDSTENGLLVIAAAGHIRGQTLFIHGRQPQTGANSPAYEVVSSAAGLSATDSPGSVQERLL
jgi:hypothetical protein